VKKERIIEILNKNNIKYENSLYISVLGRLFEGNVDVGYFIDTVNKIEGGWFWK